MGLLDGSYAVTSATTATTGSSSSSSAAAAGDPPKAIFLKLSPAVLQHLRSLKNANAAAQVPGIQLQFAAAGATGGNGGAGKQPSAIVIGESSYPINLASSSSGPTSSGPPRSMGSALVTDLLSSSSSAASTSYTQTHNRPSTSAKPLTVLASACRDQYIVSGAPVAIARKVVNTTASSVKEKTAANMGERIRERALQLEKEKEARKVVIVDDASLLAAQAGKKGKGKGKATVGIQAKASPLMKASSSLSVKRAASPASSPKNSPQLGATKVVAARQTSRLVASEAAKGLMGRKEKERAEQQAAIEAANRSRPIAQSEPASTANLAVKPVTSAQPIGSQKVRVASSTSSASSYSSTSTAATQGSSATSIASAPQLQTHSTAPKTGPPPITQASGMVMPGLARPGQPQRYHRSKVDEDDLASASSDSDDEDARPLAKKAAPPAKAVAPVVPAAKAAAPAPAEAQKGATPKMPAVPSPKVAQVQSKSQPIAAAPAVSATKAAKETAAHPSSTQSKQSPPQPQNTKTQPIIVSASTSRSSSSSSHSEPLAQAKAPVKRKRSVSTDKSGSAKAAKRTTTEEKSPKPAVKATKALNEVEQPVLVKEKETAPRVQARTSGGARLSKPLPRRSPESRSISPARAPSAKDGSDVRKEDAALSEKAAAPEAPTSQKKAAPAPSLSLSIPPASSPGPSSRNTSPLPSPSSLTHTLPAKPVSAASSVESKSRGNMLSASKMAAPAAKETGRLSVPSSPRLGAKPMGILEASGLALPASLPARPSTIIPPTGRSNSYSKAGYAAAETQPAPVSGPPSSSGANSPIVSNFARKDVEPAGSPMGQKRKSDASDMSDSYSKPAKAQKVSSTVVASAASAEDGQADDGEEDADGEIEEGEEDGQIDSFIDEGHSEGQPRGRPSEQKSVTASAVSAAPMRLGSKSGLPSFSKKGRAGQLAAAEGGRSSSKANQASRAATPNNANPSSRESSPAVPAERTSLHFSIGSDAEYKRLAKRFSDELFPAYRKVHEKLDEIKQNLAHEARKGIPTAVSPSDLAKMVEDANAKGVELQAIKDAMAAYNRTRQ